MGEDGAEERGEGNREGKGRGRKEEGKGGPAPPNILA